MKGFRKKEDPYNAIIAGFLTGGALAVRGGRRAATTSAIGCACLLAVIEGVGIGIQRMMAENTRLDVSCSCRGIWSDSLHHPNSYHHLQLLPRQLELIHSRRWLLDHLLPDFQILYSRRIWHFNLNTIWERRRLLRPFVRKFCIAVYGIWMYNIGKAVITTLQTHSGLIVNLYIRNHAVTEPFSVIPFSIRLG